MSVDAATVDAVAGVVVGDVLLLVVAVAMLLPVVVVVVADRAAVDVAPTLVVIKAPCTGGGLCGVRGVTSSSLVLGLRSELQSYRGGSGHFGSSGAIFDTASWTEG